MYLKETPKTMKKLYKEYLVRAEEVYLTPLSFSAWDALYRRVIGDN